MKKDLVSGALLFVALTLLTGVAYPLVITGIAQWTMPHAANGSVLRAGEAGDRAVGSALIGQPFSDSRYFWSRPSATSPQPYNGLASSGSNLATTNPALATAVKERIAALRTVDPDNRRAVPIDLVTASGSGLDPHISPAAAEFQAERVARVRGLRPEAVRELIARHTERRDLGILGEPRVNVLRLNLALDAAR